MDRYLTYRLSYRLSYIFLFLAFFSILMFSGCQKSKKYGQSETDLVVKSTSVDNGKLNSNYGLITIWFSDYIEHNSDLPYNIYCVDPDNGDTFHGIVTSSLHDPVVQLKITLEESKSYILVIVNGIKGVSGITLKSNHAVLFQTLFVPAGSGEDSDDSGEDDSGGDDSGEDDEDNTDDNDSEGEDDSDDDGEDEGEDDGDDSEDDEELNKCEKKLKKLLKKVCKLIHKHHKGHCGIEWDDDCKKACLKVIDKLIEKYNKKVGEDCQIDRDFIFDEIDCEVKWWSHKGNKWCR